MRFELLMKNHSWLFCCTLFFEVLNDINETEIFLSLKRWFVSEWEFIIKNMIAIIKQIIDESDSNCKYTNNINIKKMLYY